MKTFVLLFLMILLKPLQMNSQNKLNIKFYSGTNFQENILKTGDSLLNYNVFPGFQIGIEAEKSIEKHFSAGIGFEFTKMNSGLKDIVYHYSADDDTLALADLKAELSNIRIPVFLSYKPLNGKRTNPYIKLGIVNIFRTGSIAHYQNPRLIKEDLSDLEYDLYYDYFYNVLPNSIVETEGTERVYSISPLISTGLWFYFTKKMFFGLDASYQLSGMYLFFNGYFGMKF